MSLHDLLLAPFAEYAFMRRALAACLILALGGAPLGFFMTQRRMALTGDALSHAILPGVAAAFLAGGLTLWTLTLGGMAAGVAVAALAGLLTRFTTLREDSAFTLLYLLSIATGVTLVALKGSGPDLLHMLFGNILAIDADSLWLVTGTTGLSLVALAFLYRRLVIGCFDPDFLKTLRADRGGTDLAFFVLLMLNLVAAFQALGTLMALGLMILPAIAARFWSRNLDLLLPLCLGIAWLGSGAGLLASWHAQIPSGPAIVLALGAVALLSALLGRYGSVLAALTRRG